jgi:hypothetical protein
MDTSCPIPLDEEDNRLIEWRITFLRWRSRRKAPCLTSSKKRGETAAKCSSVDFVGGVDGGWIHPCPRSQGGREQLHIDQLIDYYIIVGGGTRGWIHPRPRARGGREQQHIDQLID